jgi:hypothetical protein
LQVTHKRHRLRRAIVVSGVVMAFAALLVWRGLQAEQDDRYAGVVI